MRWAAAPPANPIKNKSPVKGGKKEILERLANSDAAHTA